MVHSSRNLRCHVPGPYPHQGSDPREPSGQPCWALIEGKEQLRGVILGGFAVGPVLGGIYGHPPTY